MTLNKKFIKYKFVDPYKVCFHIFFLEKDKFWYAATWLSPPGSYDMLKGKNIYHWFIWGAGMMKSSSYICF